MGWDLNAGDLAMSLLFVAVEKEGFRLHWEHPQDRVWCSVCAQYLGLRRPQSVATKQKRSGERVAAMPVQPLR